VSFLTPKCQKFFASLCVSTFVNIAQNQQNLIIISTMTTFLCFFSIYPGQTQKKITWNMPSKEYHPTESQLKEVTVAMTLKHKNIRHLEKSHDMTPLTTIHLWASYAYGQTFSQKEVAVLGSLELLTLVVKAILEKSQLPDNILFIQYTKKYPNQQLYRRYNKYQSKQIVDIFYYFSQSFMFVCHTFRATGVSQRSGYN
jgi:hypothetical protein